MRKLSLAIALATMAALPAMAQTSVSDIVSGAETTFTAVATLCVTIGVFFVGYRLAKRVK